MPSWEWYFPYHHAPLLGDIAALLTSGAGAAALAASWPASTHPLRPYEQLMAVLPPASGLSALPPPYANLTPNRTLTLTLPLTLRLPLPLPLTLTRCASRVGASPSRAARRRGCAGAASWWER